MAQARAQARWRRKHSLIKSQLNVMARSHTHEALDAIAGRFGLRGKGEAVAFACFLTRAVLQRAEYDQQAAILLDDVSRSYHSDREMYAA